MSPIVMVTFVISLAVVEYRYAMERTQSRAQNISGMPRWLHFVLYRRSPYSLTVEDERVSVPYEGSGRWHYHSHQRGLIRMEAEEAFELRWIVLMVLVLILVLVPGTILTFLACGLWCLLRWVSAMYK